MLSHELRKNKIDGEKQIIQNPGEKQRSEMTKCSFEKFEVYAIDILMSTGEGMFFFFFLFQFLFIFWSLAVVYT